MTKDEMRTKAIEIESEIRLKANTANLWYVVCLWMSPISEAMECRKAWFDDIVELTIYRNRLSMHYKEKNRPYYILSNAMEPLDGGLFD